MKELGTDYIKYVKSLNDLGLRIAENYHLKQEGTTIIVEQFLFPEGTALDNITKTKYKNILDKIISDIILSYLIPILESNNTTLKDVESPVFFDASLKNFAILTDNIGNIRNYYVDLFVPRIRKKNGKIKEFNGNLHKHNPSIIEYRFFSKPGIIHNFIRKTYLDLEEIGVKDDFIKKFFIICDKLLNTYLKKFFNNKKSIELAKTDFNISLIEYEEQQ